MSLKPETVRTLVGKRIRQLRKAAEIPQLRFAAQAKISRANLWSIESGKKSATTDTLTKIANALGVEPVELFRFVATSEPPTNEDKLARSIASMATGASKVKIKRFEKMARLYFKREDED